MHTFFVTALVGAVDDRFNEILQLHILLFFLNPARLETPEL